MGKKWDYDVPSQEIWEEALRVLKPGGYLLAFAGTRTQHRMAVRIEDAGFEIRDMIAWVYASGFPKSLNIGKAVDKLQGNERKIVGENPNHRESDALYELGFQGGKGDGKITKGTSAWEGWGTALKPAIEPITVARKPLSEKSVAENVLKWGTGGIDIDGSRVGYVNEKDKDGAKFGKPQAKSFAMGTSGFGKLPDNYRSSDVGRFPANLIHDGSDEVVDLFPNTKGSSGSFSKEDYSDNENGATNFKRGDFVGRDDGGSAARFFKACPQDELCLLCLTPKRSRMEICQNEKLDQIVSYVGNLCDLCGTHIVQEVVKIKNSDSSQEGLQVIQDFIGNSKKCFLLQSLASYAEKMDNIDTTQTTQNLLKLFGSANRVITNYIKEIEKSEPKRFAYIPKASKAERNRGLENLENKSIGVKGNGLGRICETCGISQLKPELCSCEVKSWVNPSVKNFHPTVKPIALMEYLVKLVSREGAVVLDPFAGSGSTGVACQNLKREFIGCEMNEDYIPIIQARLGNPEIIKIGEETKEIKEIKEIKVAKKSLSECCQAEILKGYCVACCEKV